MSSKKKILVIGSNGQIGTVLTLNWEKKYGFENVIGSDLKSTLKGKLNLFLNSVVS